jgi:cyclopropane-fatty-acyl-phospholipid synthase
VGPRNYRTFFDASRRLLVSDGLMLLHTIGGLTSVAASDPWIDRYVFPGAVLPSAAEITRAMEGRFVLEDWHNFGVDYDRTLMAWHQNFEEAWPTLSPRYGERFHRLWRYYLLTCAGAFRARSNQLWQLVLSPRGVTGGYRRPTA